MRSRAGVHENDLQRPQGMADPAELLFHIGRRHHVAVREMPEVELHRRLQAPLQRHLVDGYRPFAAVHRRCVVVGRVQMGAVVGGDPYPFDRPPLAVGKVRDGGARKERHHLRRGLPVVVVVDLREVAGRVGGDPGLQRNGQIDEPANRHGRMVRRPGVV